MSDEIKEVNLPDNMVVTEKGAVSFNLVKGKSACYGLFGEGRIWVHGVYGELKPFIDYLVDKFGTNKVVFTPIINDNVLIAVHGFEKKSLPPNHPENPYGETMFYLEGEWKND